LFIIGHHLGEKLFVIFFVIAHLSNFIGCIQTWICIVWLGTLYSSQKGRLLLKGVINDSEAGPWIVWVYLSDNALRKCSFLICQTVFNGKIIIKSALDRFLVSVWYKEVWVLHRFIDLRPNEFLINKHMARLIVKRRRTTHPIRRLAMLTWIVWHATRKVVVFCM